MAIYQYIVTSLVPTHAHLDVRTGVQYNVYVFKFYYDPDRCLLERHILDLTINRIPRNDLFQEIWNQFSNI